ncbi:MAG: hypothetical protein ACYC8T_24960 [Myxococcaceae bacterium]
MTTSMQRYWSLVDALRAQRCVPGWKPEDDRVLLERIDEVFETLDDDSQTVAHAGSWRGWPDEYLEHLERELIEDVDPDDGAAATRPPRRMAA